MYKLSPAVPGGLGPGTRWDDSVSPPKITVLEMEIDGWDGDGLLETHPIFMVTEELASEMREARLSGWSTRPMTVRTTEAFDVFHPGVRLPELAWLDVSGSPGIDDVALTEKLGYLVVSEKAFDVVGKHLVTAEYTFFVPGVTPE